VKRERRRGEGIKKENGGRVNMLKVHFKHLYIKMS
jgi:hypothetical protein